METLPPCVRLQPIVVVIAVICILLFLVVPLAVAAVALAVAPWDVSVPITVGAVAFVAIIGYAMSSSLQWVELDGGTIRGRRLLTRRIVEHQVRDIVDAQPLHSKMLGPMENAIMDYLLDTSNRGYQLRFRDGAKLALIRADMSGLDAFLGALADEIARSRQQASSARAG